MGVGHAISCDHAQAPPPVPQPLQGVANPGLGAALCNELCLQGFEASAEGLRLRCRAGGEVFENQDPRREPQGLPETVEVMDGQGERTVEVEKIQPCRPRRLMGRRVRPPAAPRFLLPCPR